MTDSNSLAPLFPILTAIAGASAAAAYVYLNSWIQKKSKRGELYGLLRAELANLARHCSVCSREVGNYKTVDTAEMRTLKYSDRGTMLFDTKDAYLLHESLCQDLMQLSLLSRNNDIFVDHLLERLAHQDTSPLRDGEFLGRVQLLRSRFQSLEELCVAVANNLEKYIEDPRKYAEPTIDW